MIAIAANAGSRTACKNPTRPCPPLRSATSIAIGALALALLTFGLACPTSSQAQPNSNRPIRIIVGAGAGGSLDIEVRILGKALADVLGQDVVIEDRPGGSGVIAGQVVADAAPDGDTLYAYGGDLFTVASLMPRSSFDPNKQLLPVAQISDTPLVVVAGGHAIFSGVKGLVAAAKASPQSLTYGTFAVASVNNVAGQWIAKEAGIKLLNVTYRSGNEAALAVVAGTVALAISSPAAVYPSLVNGGTVRVIGLTGAEHPSYLPSSWPTFAQNGLPIDATTFFGVWAPVGIPDTVVARLDHGISVALSDNAVRERLAHFGIFPAYLGRAAFAARIRKDASRYDQIIREMHMIDAQR
jgi:tripartite-type tricarboxylate transporter receptor subunit TctC